VPRLADDQELRRFAGRLKRSSVFSAAAAQILVCMDRGIDVRQVLPTVSVPTLVLDCKGDMINVEHVRYLARHIKVAKCVEFASMKDLTRVGDPTSILRAIESFLTGKRRDIEAEYDRVLATILFTDIVESTNLLVALGDRGWKDLLNQHCLLVREQLA